MRSSLFGLLFVISAAIAFHAEPARAQEVVITVAPPHAYIATAQPEYFENRPVYYYNGYWHYRDGGRWLYYRREPVYLRERRAHWGEPGREYRERAEWRERVERERREHREREWHNRYHYRR